MYIAGDGGLVAKLCLTLCDPMDCVAHQAPLSMEFSRQVYWSGLPFPSPGSSPARDWTWVSCTADRFFYQWSHQGSPIVNPHNTPMRMRSGLRDCGHLSHDTRQSLTSLHLPLKSAFSLTALLCVWWLLSWSNTSKPGSEILGKCFRHWCRDGLRRTCSRVLSQSCLIHRKALCSSMRKDVTLQI